MNGHDLREGMRVRVVMTGRNAGVLGKDRFSGLDGTVIKRGSGALGSQPTWALVDLDMSQENPHRFNAWDLLELDDAGAQRTTHAIPEHSGETKR
jgi:hypothetical protein